MGELGRMAPRSTALAAAACAAVFVVALSGVLSAPETVFVVDRASAGGVGEMVMAGDERGQLPPTKDDSVAAATRRPAVMPTSVDWDRLFLPPGSPEFERLRVASIEASRLAFLPQGPGLCFAVGGKKVCREDGSASQEELDELVRGVNGRLPGFGLLGNAQSGTTFLYSILTQHPDVAHSKTKRKGKEVHYFDLKLHRKAFRAPATANPAAEGGEEKRQQTSTNALGKRGEQAAEPREGGTQHSASDDGKSPAAATEAMAFDESRRVLANLDNYFQLFTSSLGPNKLIGDYTPNQFATDAGSALWYRGVVPGLKIIVLLRDPIAKLYSRYTMVGQGRICKSSGLLPSESCSRDRTFDNYVFEDLAALAKHCPGVEFPTTSPLGAYTCGTRNLREPHWVVDTDSVLLSLYGTHLAHWMRFFPREQFLFLDSSEIFSDVHAAVRRATDFLELKPFDATYLDDVVRKQPHNSHAESADLARVGTISASTRSALNTFFASSNKVVEELTGIHLGPTEG